MKKSRPLPFVGLGLAVILSVIFCVVSATAPPPSSRTPDMTLAEHESFLYFIDAKILAKRMPFPPDAHWGHFLDPSSLCRPIGNGVWYAEGTFFVQGSPRDTVPWQVAFVPGSGDALYTRVGNLQSGDVNEARRRAALAGPADGGRR